MSNTKRPRHRQGHDDSQPIDFNLDAVTSAAQLRPFVIQHAGQRWTLAHMDTLDAWELLAAADGGEAEALRGIFALALGNDWSRFRSHPMPRHKMDTLFSAYRKHCGVAAGESPASTDS